MKTYPDMRPKTIAAAAEEALALLELWNERRDEKSMPAWADFTLEALGRWLGDINLVEVVDGGADFKFRVYGTRLAEAMGYDMTGRTVRALSKGDLAERSLTYYRTVLRTQKPQFLFHRAPDSSRQRNWIRIAMPLAHGSGRVERVIGFGQALLAPEPGERSICSAAALTEAFPAISEDCQVDFDSLVTRYRMLTG